MSHIHSMTRAEARIPQIIEGQIQGQTNIQIAESLGVNRKTITRDTQTPLYETMINEFFQFYTDKLRELGNSEQVTIQLEITKELGRMYRAGMTKHTQITEDRTLTANINITEDRKKKDELIKSLELTPDQYKTLEDTFTKENNP